MSQVRAFLQSLTHNNIDGRIYVYRSLTKPNHGCLRFLLLNPEEHFEPLLRDARAILFIGGTLHPHCSLTTQLLSNRVDCDRVIIKSFGHVIPEHHLQVLSIARGPSSHTPFDFSYLNRSTALLDELGRLVYNICAVIPDGLVLFFPSYEFKDQVLERWKSNGFYQKINSRKRVFEEFRRKGEEPNAFQLYSTFLEEHRRVNGRGGAVLSCVIGGKLSEGIDFKDHLARGIVVVGLPYPNPNDPILKEKMSYMQRQYPQQPNAGKEYYENLCMNAVNQAIGRAVRHADDYASILLVDSRFQRSKIVSKLPDWIKARVRVPQDFSECFRLISTFFRSLKSQTQ